MIDYRLENEVRIPAPAMQALAAAADRGGEVVAAAVRDAGRTAGEEITRRVAGLISLSELDTDDFWSAVNAETAARGLGTYEWNRGIGGHAELIVLGKRSKEEFLHTIGTPRLRRLVARSRFPTAVVPTASPEG